jgi:2-polyprenyl-6-methoxyphenol hydroxylase-like FAD-dependent oxidoreductase
MYTLPCTSVGESLIPSSQQLLRELGAWDRFVADEHLPCYGNASAWGSDELAYTDFIRSPYGHGWHLDRARFDATLRAVAADAGVEIRNERWDGTTDADWIVDCGGRAAPVARTFGVERTYIDRLIAFFARFEALDDDSMTFVESAPDGWFHSALLPGERASRPQSSSVSLDDSSPAETASDCGRDVRSPSRVITFFTDTPVDLRELVGSSKHIRAGVMLEEPQARDARSGRLASFHGERWIAAGDAALSFDPLSSQGIYASQYSGKKAAETLISGRFSEYDERMNELWERFLDNRSAMYAQEQRWSGRPFWQARAQR